MMRLQGSGRIIQVSSVGGRVGPPQAGAYRGRTLLINESTSVTLPAMVKVVLLRLAISIQVVGGDASHMSSPTNTALSPAWPRGLAAQEATG